LFWSIVMKKIQRFFFLPINLILLLFFWPSSILATYYRTLGQDPKIIQQLIEYHEHVYQQEIEKKIQDAKEYLDRRLTTRKGVKLAIVLDIDESALSNYESLKRMSFTKNPQAIASAFLLSEGTPITPILELYQYAHQHNVATFFICERPQIPEMVSATVKNLRQAGYDNWTKIFFRPINNDNLSTALFKQNARKQIADEDYVIILNIGDQPTDLEGGYSEVTIRLPNPYYQVL